MRTITHDEIQTNNDSYPPELNMMSKSDGIPIKIRYLRKKEREPERERESAFKYIYRKNKYTVSFVVNVHVSASVL